MNETSLERKLRLLVRKLRHRCIASDKPRKFEITRAKLEARIKAYRECANLIEEELDSCKS